MTNSRTESATRNKKRRVEFVDDAPEEATRARNSAVNLTDPLKLVGSRLEPIHGLLESQPPSLQTNIIRLTKLMLEKLDKINLRVSNCTRFHQPVKDPKTGNILKDKDDVAVKFVPQSLRAACPIKASNEFKDEPQMTTLLLEAQRYQDEWKQKMATIAETVAKLEVSLRMGELKEILYDHALSMIEAKLIEKKILNETPEGEATNDDYASIIAYRLFGKLTEPQANKFGFFATAQADAQIQMVMANEDGTTTDPPEQRQATTPRAGTRKFAMDFIETKKINLQTLADKFDQASSIFMVMIANEVEPLFMGTSFLLWEAIRRKDQSKQINAAIKKSYEPKIIEKATEEVAMVIDRLDLANPPKSLDDYVNKLVEAKINKAKTAAKQTQRKKSGADVKNQTSAPTKNGTSSKKESSDRSRSSKSTAKQKKSSNKTAEQKTTPKDKNHRKKQSKPSDKHPSQGKSRRGGRGSGAEKR